MTCINVPSPCAHTPTHAVWARRRGGDAETRRYASNPPSHFSTTCLPLFSAPITRTPPFRPLSSSFSHHLDSVQISPPHYFPPPPSSLNPFRPPTTIVPRLWTCLRGGRGEENGGEKRPQSTRPVSSPRPPRRRHNTAALFFRLESAPLFGSSPTCAKTTPCHSKR